MVAWPNSAAAVHTLLRPTARASCSQVSPRAALAARISSVASQRFIRLLLSRCVLPGEAGFIVLRTQPAGPLAAPRPGRTPATALRWLAGQASRLHRRL